MSRSERERVARDLNNAYMGLDKFGPNSPQGKQFKRQIERLKRRKAELDANRSPIDTIIDAIRAWWRRKRR